MLGKQKCKILKEIRQRIADENDIPYVTRECTHQGNCAGTCPRCESELRYLERQLALRSSMGKRVAVAALCAGMTLGAAGCISAPRSGGGEDVSELGGAVPYEDAGPEESEIYMTSGEVAWPEEPEETTSTETPEPQDADFPPETDEIIPVEFELSGDVDFPPETGEIIPVEFELSGMVAYPDEDYNG